MQGIYRFPSDPEGRGNELTEFQESIARYLHGKNFDYFATFTTKKPISFEGGRRVAGQIARAVGAPENAAMFWALEEFTLRYGCHIHALIRDNIRNAFNPDLPVISFSELKAIGDRYGRNVILPCQGLAASFYISKYITKKISDYDYCF